ncbi:hypothetical protein GH714_029905 [Hevea brasiliensis]|uniref:CG-1 domain-containing protein n=1 Tax=Hevea brasiliensis TaxID=3981 RepID=A0A6A6KXX1_HEVBR|nr:hypothetical protein GH714_029905 [Hevea brasiliensis]
MSKSGYDINVLFQEAQTRWLKPAEVLYILQNHDKYQFTQEPPQKPTSGSLFLFNKRVLRFFRKDGHDWRKKKDGRTVGEAHERLKVGNVEALNCYYAHGEQNSNFQRRSYWMLDPESPLLDLLHSHHHSSLLLSAQGQSRTTQNRDSTSAVSDLCDPRQTSSSPSSVEVSSEIGTKDNGLETTTGYTSSAKDEVSRFLRSLEEQLSLNEDSIEEVDPLYSEQGTKNDSELLEFEKQISKKDHYENLLHGPEYIVNKQCYAEPPGFQMQINNLVHLQDAGDSGKYHQSVQEHADGSKESMSWNEVLEPCRVLSSVEYQEKPQPSLREPAEEHEYSRWLNFNGAKVRNSSVLLPQEVQNVEIPAYSPVLVTHETNPDYHPVLYDQGQLEVPIEADSSLTIAQQQKFTIHEIYPEWGFTSEATKVIVVGSFLCNPSECAWTCMFGDTEVPIEIIQEGVLRCEAPPHLPGKVTFCITSGNRESCSEMLLSDSFLQKEDSIETGTQLLRKLKTDNDSWGTMIETLLVGNGTSTGTVDWLLQQLLKDKLQQWLSSKSGKTRST